MNIEGRRLANLGPRYSESWGTWEVEWCHTGMHRDDGTFETFDLDTGEKVLIRPRARWSVEHIEPNTGLEARDLWERRKDITDLVLKMEAQTPRHRPSGPMDAFLSSLVDGSHLGGNIPTVRLRAERDGRGWVISEYDWGRWTARLEV